MAPFKCEMCNFSSSLSANYKTTPKNEETLKE